MKKEIMFVMIEKDLLAVLKAVMRKKDTGRPAMECINVGKGFIEATDGKILVRSYEERACVEGTYRILSEKKHGIKGLVEVGLSLEDVSFPNTEGSIPAKTVHEHPATVGIFTEKLDPLSLTTAVINIFKLTGKAFQYPMLEKLAPVGRRWVVTAPVLGALRLDSEFGSSITAVLMPFNPGEA